MLTLWGARALDRRSSRPLPGGMSKFQNVEISPFGLDCLSFPLYTALMDLVFRDDDLDRLEADASFDGGHQPAIVIAFRKRMQQIRAAVDERDFYNQKSLRFEKLKGKRAHQYSMRLNDQWRLILEFQGRGRDKVVVVVRIEDYH